jgi:hypothetical protein
METKDSRNVNINQARFLECCDRFICRDEGYRFLSRLFQVEPVGLYAHTIDWTREDYGSDAFREFYHQLSVCAEFPNGVKLETFSRNYDAASILNVPDRPYDLCIEPYFPLTNYQSKDDDDVPLYLRVLDNIRQFLELAQKWNNLPLAHDYLISLFVGRHRRLEFRQKWSLKDIGLIEWEEFEEIFSAYQHDGLPRFPPFNGTLSEHAFMKFNIKMFRKLARLSPYNDQASDFLNAEIHHGNSSKSIEYRNNFFKRWSSHDYTIDIAWPLFKQRMLYFPHEQFTIRNWSPGPLPDPPSVQLHSDQLDWVQRVAQSTWRTAIFP